ncbi:MAG: hypothetical protein ABSG94_02520 [Brevinematales bacterium]
MNKRLFVIIVVLSGLVISCSETSSRHEAPGKTLKASVLLFGVGYDQDRAQTDLNSVFYAFRQGVIYQFKGEELKLRMDYSNKTAGISIEDLTYARLKKPMENFYIYEMPYTGIINLRGGGGKKISTQLTIRKPFSYLTRMVAIALMNELGASHAINEKGYVYLTALNYSLTPDNSILINADLLLTKEEK